MTFFWSVKHQQYIFIHCQGINPVLPSLEFMNLASIATFHPKPFQTTPRLPSLKIFLPSITLCYTFFNTFSDVLKFGAGGNAENARFRTIIEKIN